MSGSEIRPDPFDQGRSVDHELWDTPPLFTAVSKPLEDGVTLVIATGELDMASAPVLAGELALATQAVLLLDLSAVTFMDSSGIRVLLDAHAKAAKSATSLRLYGVPHAVHRPLEITGITDLFAIYETQAAALAGTNLV